MPKVKNFLHNQAKEYPNLAIEWKHGADPVIEFLDSNNKVVESARLAPFNEQEIHQLLKSKGLFRNEKPPVQTP